MQKQKRKEVRYGDRMHVLLQITAQAKNKKSYCRRRRTVTFTTLDMILDSHASYYHCSNGSRVQSIEMTYFGWRNGKMRISNIKKGVYE